MRPNVLMFHKNYLFEPLGSSKNKDLNQVGEI
jgi:hypothetical protein